MIREIEARMEKEIDAIDTIPSIQASKSAQSTQSTRTKATAAASKQADLEARAMAALADPDLSDEGKAQVRTMLAQIRSQAKSMSMEEEALATATAEAEAMRQEMERMQINLQDDLESKVVAALEDPSLSEEAKEEVYRMYMELKETAKKKDTIGCPDGRGGGAAGDVTGVKDPYQGHD